MIDARGLAFVPGLTDSHIHPLLGTIQTRGVDLFDAADLTEIARSASRESGNGRTKVGARLGSPLRAVRGIGIRGDLFDDVTQRAADASELLRRHTDLANHAALARRPASPARSSSRKRPRSSASTAYPAGELQESAAMGLVRRCSRTGCRYPVRLVRGVIPPLQRGRPDGRSTPWTAHRKSSISIAGSRPMAISPAVSWCRMWQKPE